MPPRVHRASDTAVASQVLGGDVADTVLAHLPPHGERVATAAQIDALRAATGQQIDTLRADLEALRSHNDQQVESLRAEMHHLFELHGERLAARWRRDLLLLAVPQFLVLLGIIVSLNV
jgi:hypothetical protein